MTAHPLPIWALTARAEQAGRESTACTRYERVPPETAYWCSGCGEYVDGETYEAPSGVTRVCCERCGSEPPELQSREE